MIPLARIPVLKISTGLGSISVASKRVPLTHYAQLSGPMAREKKKLKMYVMATKQYPILFVPCPSAKDFWLALKTGISIHRQTEGRRCDTHVPTANEIPEKILQMMRGHLLPIRPAKRTQSVSPSCAPILLQA